MKYHDERSHLDPDSLSQASLIHGQEFGPPIFHSLLRYGLVLIGGYSLAGMALDWYQHVARHLSFLMLAALAGLGLLIGVVHLMIQAHRQWCEIKIAAANGHKQACGGYQLESFLGGGGMGQVYKASKIGTLSISHALKVISLREIDESRNPREIEKILKEPRLLSSMNHPNIIRVIDVGQDRFSFKEGHLPVVYIVMEYIAGLDLGQIITKLSQKDRFLPIDHALKIAISICYGLSYATDHHANFVHRDIKPANIMIGYHGEIKILDFGIAKSRSISLKTTTKSISGTPDHMSPEQINGQKLDIRSDIFALGIILYEMLTGHHPFVSEDPREMMKVFLNICLTPPPPLRQWRPEIDEELQAIITKALAKEREERYRHPAELQKELERYARMRDFWATDTDIANFMATTFPPPGPATHQEPAESSATAPSNRVSKIRAIKMRLFSHGLLATLFISAVGLLLIQANSILTQLAGPGPEHPSSLVAPRIGPKNMGPISLDQPAVRPSLPAASAEIPPVLPNRPQTVAPAPESTPPAFCQIRLQKTPANAISLIDGQLQGKGALAEIRLEAGVAHRLKVQAEGFSPHEERLTCQPAEHKTVPIHLKRLSADLVIETTPAGAELTLNGGQSLGLTPLRLTARPIDQKYRIQLQLHGYRRHEAEITLNPDEAVTTYHVSLSAARASLRIETTPAGALVYLDQQRLPQVTPLEIPGLEIERTYQLKLSLIDYLEHKTNIRLTPEHDQTLYRINLVPKQIRVCFDGPPDISAIRFESEEQPFALFGNDERVERRDTPAGQICFILKGITPDEYTVSLIPINSRKYGSIKKKMTFRPDQPGIIRIGDYLIAR
jgi:serine/threonine-protein kinase